MAVDLALLPPLSVIKQMTHEDIQEEMRKVGGLDKVSPSDPSARPILAGSYRETLLRQDMDEQARALTLADAMGTDLDHIGITYYRDAYGEPVVRLAGEGDEDYRQRLHESPAGLSVAGPFSSYEVIAKGAHPNIRQVKCVSPDVLDIVLYLLGRKGDGAVDDVTCRLVEAYMWNRRPLGDNVMAVSAEIIKYRVKVIIRQEKNHDPAAVLANVAEALSLLTESRHKLKGRLTGTTIRGKLAVPYVEDVELVGWTDIVCGEGQAPFCEGYEIVDGGWIDDEE